jgi:AcrR family transcriptional regulator
MSPRPDVSEERKKEILDAATDVFVRQGIHKARVDDIAEEAGLSKGALYWYFKSKDEIIIAMLDRIFEREFLHLQKLGSQGGSALERLNIFLDSTIADIQRWLRLVPIAYEFLGLVFRQKIVQQGFRKYFHTYTELLTALIQEGIDNDEFLASDARDVAISIGAILEGTILLWVYDPEVVDVERHIRSGMDIFIRGLDAKVLK